MADGYLVLASGPDVYLDMAVACAASIRYWDKTREIQLATDRPAFERDRRARVFDRITPFSPPEAYRGPLMKLLVSEVSTFDRTMFIDADCLMLRGDIDRYWKAVVDRDVACPGEWRSSGQWYDMKIEDICRLGGVPQIVRLNSGTLYFGRTAAATAYFDTAKQLYRDLGNFTGRIHRKLGPPDEPFLSLALARLGIAPVPIVNDDGTAWMVSTHRGSEFHLDPHDGAPFFHKGTRVSPTLCHFIGRKPRDEYVALCAAYCAEAGV